MIETLGDWGFPVTVEDTKDIIAGYLQRTSPIEKRFTNNRPGTDWVKSFMDRTNLTQRMASNIKRSRAVVNRETLDNFFHNIENICKELPPHNIFNYDETCFVDNPGAGKVITRRGKRSIEKVCEHFKASTSVMFCGSADGSLLPPMTVYKSLNIYENWTCGGPLGSIYTSTKSSWFDSVTFEKWFVEVFIAQTRHLTPPLLLIGDNLSSHFSPKVIELARDLHIYFTALPPNSTHLLQPLDVCFFAPVKKAWRNILLKWRLETRIIGTIPEEIFPSLIDRLYSVLIGLD